MRARVVPGLVLVAVATACHAEARSPSPARMAVRVRGWLHTEGTRIVDDRGRSVRLMGVNHYGLSCGTGMRSDFGGFTSGWKTPPPDEPSNVDRWGLNVVRIPVSWSNLEPVPPTSGRRGVIRHHWNMPYIHTIDALIRDLRARHIAVVLDMHQWHWSPAFDVAFPGGQTNGCGMPAWLYPHPPSVPLDAMCSFFSGAPAPTGVPETPQRGLIAAWRLLSSRYSTNSTVVGMDLVNEPYLRAGCTPSSMDLETFDEIAAEVIHHVSPHVLIFVEDNRQSDGSFLLPVRPDIPNAVYSVHLYGDWRDRLPFFERRADRWRMPMWVGEFGAFEWDGVGPPGAAADQLHALLDRLRARGVGWAYWSFGGPNGQGAATALIDPRTNLPKPQLVAILRSGL